MARLFRKEGKRLRVDPEGRRWLENRGKGGIRRFPQAARKETRRSTLSRERWKGELACVTSAAPEGSEGTPSGGNRGEGVMQGAGHT